jgi:histidinol-phosphate/aromatic aminotransferase/cobyric acid decarboxylase-like protein
LPSDANFVLIRLPVPDDLAVADRLARRGLLVRAGTEFGLRGHVRVTVAPAPLMDEVAAALAEACSAEAEGARRRQLS